MRLIDADLLQNNILEEYEADAGCEDVNIIYGMVINAPTIEAEPVRHGKWLRYGATGEPNNKKTFYWQCSECLNTEIGERDYFMSYCPYCGAKMQGDKDE